MKKALTIFLVFLLVTNANAQLTSSKTEKTEKKILELVLETLNKEHISPKKLDDDFSKKFFNSYLNDLDKYKVFFLQSDIDEFKKFETKLDDQLKNKDLSFFYLTYDRYMLRMIESKEIYTNILKNKLYFKSNEDAKLSFNYAENNSRSLVFSKDKKEQISNWNITLKTLAVNLTSSQYVQQKDYKFSLAEILDKKTEEFNNFLEGSLFNHINILRENVFSITFLNNYLKLSYSNSKYFTSKDYFSYKLSKKDNKVGTGIVISKGLDFVEIKRIESSSTAEKSKKINIGDVILKIENENQQVVNVTGFNQFQIAKLLSGKNGTSVKITLKKVNGTILEVTLKREIISQNDNYIKSCLVKKDNITFGVISFSNFYNDLQEDNSMRVSEVDFAQELESLKQENVSGIILDLRENAGESAIAAVKILANFLTKTPVAFLKTQNKSEILQIENTTINWDKNVVVLVNLKTAAAAELIANTFHEYNIGIVIGELTNGKSSIEKFQNLNDLVTNKDEFNDLGVLSFSNQKFYNLNGKSIQRKGIMPDVVFRTDNTLDREANYPQSLAPDEVKPIAFVPVNKKDYFASVIKNSQDRLSKSENFKRVNAKIAEEINFNNKLSLIKTLNLEKLNTQIEALLASEKVIEEPVFDKNRIFSLPSESIKALKKQEYLVAKRNTWLEDMKTDFQIDEGINILEDMLYMVK